MKEFHEFVHLDLTHLHLTIRHTLCYMCKALSGNVHQIPTSLSSSLRRSTNLSLKYGDKPSLHTNISTPLPKSLVPPFDTHIPSLVMILYVPLS